MVEEVLLWTEVYVLVVLEFLEIAVLLFTANLLQVYAHLYKVGGIFIAQLEDGGLQYLRERYFHQGFVWLRVYELLNFLGQHSEHAFDGNGVVLFGELSVLLGDEEGRRVVWLASDGLMELVLVGEVEAAADVVVVLPSLQPVVVSRLVDVRPQQVGLIVSMLRTLRPPYSVEVVF